MTSPVQVYRHICDLMKFLYVNTIFSLKIKIIVFKYEDKHVSFLMR